MTYRMKLTGEVSDKAIELRRALRIIKREYILSQVTHYVSTAGCAIDELWFYIDIPEKEITKTGLVEALRIFTLDATNLEEVAE
jgi:hypothetical protein